MLCGFAPASAQLYTNSRLLTTAQGLSDDRITAIYKDATGYVWIGTNNGLNRFDGNFFTTFRPLTTNSVSNEVIQDITGDSKGNVWVATRNGLNRFNPVSRSWNVWLPESDSKERGIPNRLIWDIDCDPDGSVWIAPDVYAFTHYDPATNKFEYYDWPGFVKTISGRMTPVGYHSIQKFVRKSKQEFWLASNKGLVLLNTQTGQFRFLGGGYNEDVHDLLWDEAAGTVYLTLSSGRVFVYHSVGESYGELKPQVQPYPSRELPVDKTVRYNMASPAGLLHIYENRTCALEQHIPQLRTSLPPGGVTTVYKDPSGLQWIGTPNGVLLRDVVHTRSAFLPLLPVSDKQGLNTMTGMHFSEKDDSYYLCSVQPAALFIVQRKTGSIQKITTDPSGRPLSACFTVKEAAGSLWLLTQDRLYRIEPGIPKLIPFPFPFTGLPPAFRDLVADSSGNLWIATFHKGLFRYHRATATFHQPEGEGSAYLKDVATALQFDSLRNLVWVASYGRYLHSVHVASGIITGYRETDSTKSYAFLNLSHDLAADEKGRIWVATNAGGVFYEQPKSFPLPVFMQMDMRKGLHHNQVLALAPGRPGTMWFLTGKGLSYVEVTGSRLREVELTDALPFSTWASDPLYPHELVFHTTTGELAVAVGGGLLLYDTGRKPITASFPVYIQAAVTKKPGVAVLVNEKELNHLSGPLPELQFQVSGLYFGTAPVRFEYQLEGYDRTWQHVEATMKVVYQNLPARSYTFRVRAVDETGAVVAESTALAVVLHPFFWQQWWFYALLLLAAVLIVYRIIRLLQQRLEDEKLLNQFATSLYGKSSIDDIFWDVAQNCIDLLGFEDCVLYQVDEHRGVLMQRAAAGPKSPYQSRTIINTIELPLGTGIVGVVAKTGAAERISNTAKDPRYIVDDTRRFSEITVPVFVDGLVFGVLDSEHSRKNFFTRRHMRLLKRIAAVCGERISKYLTEERLRTKIARDLHDEMGSTLTSINILSKVAMTKERNREDIQEYLQKIKKHSSSMMESMSDIIWAINPSNDSLEKLLIRMKELAAELLEPAGIMYYFDASMITNESLLNLEQRKDLYLIFKEAINNAVKYSQATEVTVLLHYKEGELLLRITDNGKGFKTSAQTPGNGLKNMNSRAIAMGADLSIESIPGVGTSIVLRKQIT